MTLRWGAALILVAASAPASELESSLLSPAKSVRGAFLARGMGARAAALGEAYAAMADDAASLSWNPAGLGRVQAMSAIAMIERLDKATGASFLAGALPTVAGVVGASLTAMDYGGFDAFDPLGTRTGSEHPVDWAASLGWAAANPELLMPRGWSGMAVEVAREAVGGSWWGVNAGWVLRPGPHYALGMSLLHAGGRRKGTGLPATARVGAAWRDGGAFAASVEGAYGFAVRMPSAAAGVEYAPVPFAALRAGYRWQGGEAAPSTGGVSAGLGLWARGVGLDYAYQPVAEELSSHRVAFTLGASPRGSF